MLVRDAMLSGRGLSVRPATPLTEAIVLLDAHGCVAPLPVCDPDTGCMVGMIAECMIATVAFSKGLDAAVVDSGIRVSHVMVPVGPGHRPAFGAAAYVFDDQQLAEARRVLEQEPALFRLPVLDRDWRLVGSLSLDDVALSGDDECDLGEPCRP